MTDKSPAPPDKTVQEKSSTPPPPADDIQGYDMVEKDPADIRESSSHANTAAAADSAAAEMEQLNIQDDNQPKDGFKDKKHKDKGKKAESHSDSSSDSSDSSSSSSSSDSDFDSTSSGDVKYYCKHKGKKTKLWSYHHPGRHHTDKEKKGKGQGWTRLVMVITAITGQVIVTEPPSGLEGS